MVLSGKNVLITGSSGSIGRATAFRLARRGANLAITGLEACGVEETVRRLRAEGASAFGCVADLSRREDVHRLFRTVLQEFGGRLDILINNAGMSYAEDALDVSEERMDYQIAVNFTAHFLLAQAAAREMIRTGGGRIVFISSTGALAAHPNTAVYDAMKAGLEALTRCLALEWGPLGIIVNAVQPGHIVNERGVSDEPTPERLAYWSAIPLRRPGQGDEVAQAIEFLVSPETTYITGEVVRVDGGRNARTPVVVWPRIGS